MKKKKLHFADSEFYFDDCAICKAMKKAEEEGRNLTINKLKGAFRKAKKKGAIIGGEFVEK